jgi:MerR family transcriptional regulator, light-induced transcriptional regulator
MWEARHGFPGPSRLPSGHRRYSERDVALVHEVLRHRHEGLSLPSAILRARASDRPPPASIFAGLRERRPELQPIVLSKGALLELTRAIEDEHCARAVRGVLIGSFQQARFYRQSQRRWQELARTARVTVALAEFPALRQRRTAPSEVPVGREHPLAREWAIVFDAPAAHACLAAWELPLVRPVPDRQRRFEVVFSPEPDVVRAALAVTVELIAQLAPAIGRLLGETLDQAVEPSTPELRSAAVLAQRMISYLGARLDGPVAE